MAVGVLRWTTVPGRGDLMDSCCADAIWRPARARRGASSFMAGVVERMWCFGCWLMGGM